MTKSRVQRVVGIDWSGRVDAAGQRRHIWAGVWTEGARGKASVRLEAGRTRAEVAEWLIEMARETPRMVVGFDFCFSFPAWFVRDEHGVRSAPEFWKRVVDDGHAERWLASGAEDVRFWGKPHKRPAEFSGEFLHRMLRATDIDCKIAALIPEAERQARVRGITPKSVFQVGGAGSVGTASLRGFAVLLRLRETGVSGVAVRCAVACWGFGSSTCRRDVYAVEYGGRTEVECGGSGGLFVEEAERGCGVCGAVARGSAEGAGGRGCVRCAGEHDGDGGAEGDVCNVADAAGPAVWD